MHEYIFQHKQGIIEGIECFGAIKKKSEEQENSSTKLQCKNYQYLEVRPKKTNSRNRVVESGKGLVFQISSEEHV